MEAVLDIEQTLKALMSFNPLQGLSLDFNLEREGPGIDEEVKRELLLIQNARKEVAEMHATTDHDFSQLAELIPDDGLEDPSHEVKVL